MSKISKRDIGIIITVVGIVILLYVYNFVFNTYNDKKDALNAEISTLSQTEMNLETLAANRPQYEAAIEEMTAENEEIIDHFPSDILPENEIMYGVELQENADIFFTDLEYGTAVLFCEDAQPAVADTTTDDTDTDETTDTEAADTTSADASGLTTDTSLSTGIQANLLSMSMEFEASYQGLKDAILYTKAQSNRMVIDGVDAAFDPTTGQLSGTITLNQYYITGTGKEYTAPYVPSVRTGVSDIFGSYESN